MTEALIQTVRAAASALGVAPERIEPLAGGANNLVFRVVAGARTLLAKVYFQHPGDSRDRLQTEFGMLDFLWKNGMRCVPEPLAADTERHIGFYEFIVGQRLRPEDITWGEVAQLVDLLAGMWRLRDRPGADALPPGSDSAFSIDGFLGNVAARLRYAGKTLASGGALAEQGRPGVSVHDQVRAFIGVDMERNWKLLRVFVEKEARKAGVELHAILPLDQRTLNPADHGFHNALYGANGHLTFLDFEYSGWDDPGQMICNACLQPAVPIPDSMQRRFLESILDRMGNPAFLSARLRLLYPLFGFKWSLIMLNEFLPVARERRAFAGMRPDSKNRQVEQLEKSRRQLKVVQDYMAAPVIFDGLG